MHPLVQDLRDAFRMMRKSPGSTLATIVSLAIGIGANSAAFSVVDALLLRALPFPQLERLAAVWLHSPALGIFRDWPTKPVIMLPGYEGGPFQRAKRTRLCSMMLSIGSWERGAGNRAMVSGPFQCVSRIRMIPVTMAGTSISVFPVTIAIQTNDFSAWRVNVTSRGRALLMLFLFSDVGEDDAPTLIRVGSNRDMVRFLEPGGDSGMSHMSLNEMSADRPIAMATGEAGTVYLCHPFLVHAAQRHRGSKPRFMAQPPLGLREPYRLHREDGAYSPVEISIRQALR
jgi:hypothetical protein